MFIKRDTNVLSDVNNQPSITISPVVELATRLSYLTTIKNTMAWIRDKFQMAMNLVI